MKKSDSAQETLLRISGAAQAFVEKVQPYNGGDYEQLGWLAAISNFDKHRAPVVATYALLQPTLSFDKPAGSRVEDLWLHHGPVVDRTEIARFTLVMTGEPGRSVMANSKLPFQEVFEEPAEVKGKPLLKTIGDMRLLVDRLLREAHALFRQPPQSDDGTVP